MLEPLDAPVGGGDEAQAGAAGGGLAQPVVVAAVEHPQQVRLQRLGQLADLVKNSVPLSASPTRPGRSRRPGLGVILGVAKEFGVDDAGGQRRRVARHEGPRAPGRKPVQRPRRQLFAAAAGARDQRVALALGVEGDQVAGLPERGALAYQAEGVGLAGS